MNPGKKALVLSVPGTGTNFTNTLLTTVFGYKLIGPRQLLKEPPGSFFTHLHVHSGKYKDQIEREDRGVSIKTVIPLRSPVAQFITRRTPQGGGDKAREESLRLWRLLLVSLPRHDYVFFPVEDDVVDNEEKVRRLARHLGAVPKSNAFSSFCKKWEKVNSSGEKPEREEYDRNGTVEIEGKDVSFLDKYTSWYGEQIEAYRREAVAV